MLSKLAILVVSIIELLLSLCSMMQHVFFCCWMLAVRLSCFLLIFVLSISQFENVVATLDNIDNNISLDIDNGGSNFADNINKTRKIPVQTKVEDQNSKQQQSQNQNHRRLFVAFVFALSFRVPQEFEYGSSSQWHGDMIDTEKLTSMFVQMVTDNYVDQKDANYMAIFPNTDDMEQSHKCWTNVERWRYYFFLDDLLKKFYGTEEARQRADIGADAYEPVRELNSALMDRAEAIIANCTSEGMDEEDIVRVVYITNFAEKSFARRNFSELAQRNPRIELPLALLAMNGATFNYHFYSIEKKQWDYSSYKTGMALHLGIPDKRFDYNDKVWSTGWHVIYMVVLSDRLSEPEQQQHRQQFYAINLAIKEPLEQFFIFSKRTTVLMLSPCYLDMDYFVQQPKWAYFWWQLDEAIGCMMNPYKAPIRTWTTDPRTISQLMNTAMTMYERQLGATLRQNQRKDAVRPMLQEERPRVVLITDIVEEDFLQLHLPDERFEFKVYVLNTTAHERFKAVERIDFLRLLNPRSPGRIPVNTTNKWAHEPPEWDAMPSWQIVALIIMGCGFLAALAFGTIIVIKRRRRQ